ncbi:MAG: phosphatidylinositol glycan class B [Saprospiraceae bacterium]|jgi:phosphatidylinositol glycan class B
MEFTKLEKRVYIISALSFILAAVFSTGYHHFDEHFQILEFAGLKLGMTEAQNLPWEFREQMRPAIQPGLTVLLYKTLSFFGMSSPFTFTLFTRLLTALLSFTAVHFIYLHFKAEFISEQIKKWFLYFSFLLWIIVYNGVRFSSENWSELLFLTVFLLYFKKEQKNSLQFFTMGLLMGFSFLFRYQTAVMTVGFFAWMLFINKEKIANLLVLSTGVIGVIAIGVLIDKWYYGEWVFSAWNYFEQNILLGKTEFSGTSPWYWYFTQTLLQGIPPLSILLICGVLGYLALFKKTAVTWIVFPFLLIHFLIAHKEIRFFYPVLFLVPYMMMKMIQKLNEGKLQGLIQRKGFTVFMKVVFFANHLFLILVVFKPADSNISLYKTLYFDYQEPTTLYFLEKNPYVRVRDIHLYKRKDLNMVQIVDVGEIPENSPTKSIVVFTNRNNPEGFENTHKLIYKSFPSWMSHFNFNNWMRRSKSWYVYDFENK